MALYNVGSLFVCYGRCIETANTCPDRCGVGCDHRGEDLHIWSHGVQPISIWGRVLAQDRVFKTAEEWIIAYYYYSVLLLRTAE